MENRSRPLGGRSRSLAWKWGFLLDHGCRHRSRSLEFRGSIITGSLPRSRADIYQPGLPAEPGHHYRAFVRFAQAHAGRSILDLGCGYGAYSLALAAEGYRCVGCDINPAYLAAAKALGLPAVAADSALPFPDRSFDTVVLFEVIEHVAQIDCVLKEAFRVARRNVLITVPNTEGIELMKDNDVTYAHMLSSDHLHFFNPEALEQLLGRFSPKVEVTRADPLYPLWFVSRSPAYYGMRLLYKAGLLKPKFFSRLYAVASIRQD